MFASTGEAIALIETRLPAADIDNSAGRLIRRLLLTALVLSRARGAGRRDPRTARRRRRFERSRESAVRLGQGDFSASIPPGGPAEVGALARTMEDMRRNLVDLTGTLRRHEAEAQAVLAGIVEGVYAVDKNRTIRYLNPQAAKLLGVQAGGSRRPLLRRCAEAALRERPAALRLQLPDSAGAPRRQRARRSSACRSASTARAPR